jgi:Na+/proline symporter
MAAIDVVLVLASLVGVVALGAWLVSRQRVSGDYYADRRKLPAWTLGVSLAANQASAISLIGAPAFVALRQGGGLRWLQCELAVPLALAVLVAWGVPLLRRAPGANVYAAVESRLGTGRAEALGRIVAFLIGVSVRRPAGTAVLESRERGGGRRFALALGALFAVIFGSPIVVAAVF